MARIVKGYFEDNPILVAMGKIQDLVEECSRLIEGRSWNEDLRLRLINLIELRRSNIVSYLQLAKGLKSSAQRLGAKLQLVEKKLRKSPFGGGYGNGKSFLRKLKSVLVVSLEAMIQGMERDNRYDEYEAGINQIKKVA